MRVELFTADAFGARLRRRAATRARMQDEPLFSMAGARYADRWLSPFNTGDILRWLITKFNGQAAARAFIYRQ